MRTQAKEDEARGNLLPSVSASGSYTRNLKKQVIFFPEEMAVLFGGNTALEVGSDNSYMGALSLTLPVYNPVILANIRAAEIEQTLSDENLRATEIDLTYNVQKAWYDALLAKESLDVIRLSFENARQNLENIQKLYEQGMVAEYDLIRAEVQTENIKPEVLQAENALDISLNFLKTIIGLEEDLVIEVRGSLLESAETMLSEFSITQAERSLLNNSDYVNLGLQKNLLMQQKQVIKSGNLPSLNAITNYAYITEANNFELAKYDWVNTASAGLQLNIPIFRGFTNRNQVKQVDISIQQLDLQKEYLKDNLNVELTNILKSMDVALQKAADAERNVELAQRGFNIARVRYDSGQGTLLELNDSEVALTRARFNLLSSKHELLTAKIRYDQFIGKNDI
ncbi:MAG: TolC family protein [Bacteroidota bacterium]